MTPSGGARAWAIRGVLLITVCATLGLSLLARLVHHSPLAVATVGALLLLLAALAAWGYLGAAEAESAVRSAMTTSTSRAPSHFTPANVC